MELSPQFDDERMARAQAIPVEQRRLRGFTARKEAAKRNATHWALQVDHSSHEDLQRGRTVTGTTRVMLSREEFPDPVKAKETAALMSLSRGHYVTGVRHE